MTIAVFSALRSELELLITALDRPRGGSIADWVVWTGEFSDNQVVLAQAGLGKVNTAALAGIIWERHRPGTMVFTGVAGGLDPNLSVGDIVVAKRTIQHDAGVIAPGGLRRYQAGHLPFFNPTDEFGYRPSHYLLEMISSVIPQVALGPVLDRQPEVHFGTVLTGDQFLQDEVTRRLLFSEFGAQAIEMEGAALAQTAARLGVDHIVIRSLSDLAGERATEDFARFLPEVSANSARLVLALLEVL